MEDRVSKESLRRLLEKGEEGISACGGGAGPGSEQEMVSWTAEGRNER